MEPLISVIIPVYNVEKYLNKCITSVVEQTYKNLEIIIVDDGSTDQSPEICDEWEKRDGRIQVVHSSNGGAGKARNTALDMATGDYVTFVDSDDYIAPQMYQVLLEQFYDGIGIVECNYSMVYDDYEQFKEDRGCSVALNPYTGEVLALVSTPSYDNNDFVRGMDNSQWSALNENEDRPLYNRFRQTWCPGSTFKSVIAAIGLKVGAFTANDDFGNEGLAWQKDSSWGDYTVTTLHDYEPVILKNALIYSDNIYFAKAALKIGADQLMQSLNQIGFNQELPFDIKMSESQYSNMDKIETEIQLADSGYGQGQILVNPLHLASIYTAFLNDGNMIKPYLHADGGSTSSEIWIKDAFSPQIVSEVMEGLEGVVNNPEGTGYGACREDIRLAGKTGTAELKATKEDTSGTEIGWFTVFTTDRDTENPILLISMVENVKDIGGSGYVVEKDKAILDEYLGNE